MIVLSDEPYFSTWLESMDKKSFYGLIIYRACSRYWRCVPGRPSELQGSPWIRSLPTRLLYVLNSLYCLLQATVLVTLSQGRSFPIVYRADRFVIYKTYAELRTSGYCPPLVNFTVVLSHSAKPQFTIPRFRNRITQSDVLLQRTDLKHEAHSRFYPVYSRCNTKLYIKIMRNNIS